MRADGTGHGARRCVGVLLGCSGPLPSFPCLSFFLRARRRLVPLSHSSSDRREDLTDGIYIKGDVSAP